MFGNLSSKKATKNPSAGPTTDGFESRNGSGGIPDHSLFPQDKSKKDLSQPGKAKRGKEKPSATLSKEEHISPAVEFGQQLLDKINTAPSEELDDKVSRVLGSVWQHLAMMFLISGACAYKLTKNIKIETGAGNVDDEKKGKLSVYKRVGSVLDRSSRTVEDDKRIYQYCVAEPVDKFADKQQRKMREKTLLAQAVQLPRAFLLKAATVIDSAEALEIAFRNRQEPGRKSYTLSEFAADIENFPRRNKSKQDFSKPGKQGGGENATSPPDNFDYCLSIKRSVNLSKRSETCLDEICRETKFSADETINQALIYCREHLEHFAASPEVLSA